MTVKLAPSILSADFASLGSVARETEAAGADYVHIDVMDGRFVPPLTIGPLVVEAFRKHTELPLDVHLMVVEPEHLIPDFISAGADMITVHQETVTHLPRVVQQIKGLGATAGVALNPSTPTSVIEEILPDLDLVLAMTVNPGYGGQKLIPRVLSKVHQIRQMIDTMGLEIELEVDGGIKPDNVGALVAAGASIIVAGSAVYGHKAGIAQGIAEMRGGMGVSRNIVGSS